MWDSDSSHEIKRHLFLGRKAMTNLDSVLQSRDIILLTKVCIVKAMVFPVVVYGYESWTIKKASVQFSRSVVSDSLWLHELQHIRPPCPSPTLEFTQIHVHRVSDAIQPSHPLSSPSPPALNPSQHQSLSTEELMLLNCGVGEGSWESLGLQRDQSSQS